MNTDQSTERIVARAREMLSRSGRIRRRQTTRSVARFASYMTLSGTRSMGRRASSGAREAVEGAVSALGAMGGETRAFVRDAVIGVVEGTSQVMTVTGPAVRDIVAGGIKGSGRLRSDSDDAGRDVVAGAIVGAESVGFDDTEAVAAAVEGAVEGFAEVGGDLDDAARSAIRGVVSGVAATGGDVATATRDATTLLIARAAASEPTVPMITSVAVSAIDAVFLEACRSYEIGNEVIIAAATGVVEAAYRIDRPCGDSVREAVMERVAQPSINLPPRVRRRLPDIETQLTSELSPTAGAWRARAIFRAVPLLINASGVDLAASLAYFTILSIFPLIAVLIIGIAVLGNPEVIRVWSAEILTHYFPASSELINDALRSLIRGALAFGAIALVGILVGANGMFSAANRAVNRVFGMETRSIIQTRITEIIFATFLGSLFLFSLLLSAFFNTAISISEGFAISPWSISHLIAILFGTLSTLVPIALTALVFAVFYHHMPNTRIEWRDATFGALIAVVLFEIGKQTFFWFTGVLTQRSIVYGPIASFVVLLMWAYIASLIFLYGSALTRVSGEIRPRGIFRSRP